MDLTPEQLEQIRARLEAQNADLRDQNYQIRLVCLRSEIVQANAREAARVAIAERRILSAIARAL